MIRGTRQVARLLPSASGPSRADTEKAFRTAVVLLAGANGHGVAASGRGVRQWLRRRRAQQLVVAPRYPRHRVRRHHDGVHVLRQRR